MLPIQVYCTMLNNLCSDLIHCRYVKTMCSYYSDATLLLMQSAINISGQMYTKETMENVFLNPQFPLFYCSVLFMLSMVIS